MKTHQEKLSELKVEMRKAIPRLMELSEGCVIENEYKTKYKIYYNEIRYYNVFNDELVSNSIVKPLSKSYNIIGKEPQLNDVLEWLGNKFINNNTNYITQVLSLWDLSKPYLKDQSEDLINFLYNLIK